MVRYLRQWEVGFGGFLLSIFPVTQQGRESEHTDFFLSLAHYTHLLVSSYFRIQSRPPSPPWPAPPPNLTWRSRPSWASSR